MSAAVMDILINVATQDLLFLSTKHITRKDNTLLGLAATQHNWAGFVVWNTSPGWIVRFLPDVEQPISEGDFGFSSAFCALISAAIELGCEYIRIGPDGSEIAGLPVFEW